MHQHPLSAGALPQTPLGELMTPPRPLSRLERGIPPPHSLPPRRLRRLQLSRPPQHKILATAVQRHSLILQSRTHVTVVAMQWLLAIALLVLAQTWNFCSCKPSRSIAQTAYSTRFKSELFGSHNVMFGSMNDTAHCTDAVTVVLPKLNHLKNMPAIVVPHMWWAKSELRKISYVIHSYKLHMCRMQFEQQGRRHRHRI